MAEKKKYKIAVYATYKRVVEIEAQSTDAAVAAVEAMWSDEHISMCPHDPDVHFVVSVAVGTQATVPIPVTKAKFTRCQKTESR